MNKVELLAPAGDWSAFVGAINAGANAVYLAGKRFGARAYADNFDQETLIKALTFAHLRNVKVYITINTLIYDDEIDDLISYADFLVEHQIDGIIVQDIGMLNLFIHRYPDTEIHASTQMNILTVDQAAFLKGMGVKRIILARETSIETIKAIKASVDIELEVFVHGALCVSYSGNCLFSSMMGGRSGNRGQCAQPCRLAYSLVKDDTIVEDTTYLLSTKDLMTIHRLDELIEAGVSSLKIEGRMRKNEYVIQTVLSYRKALDNPAMDLNQEITNLKKVFNRDYTEGYLFGIKPKTINHSFRPNHMGVEIGTVVACDRGKVTIALTDLLSVGDGIRFVKTTDFGLGVSRILKNNESVKHAFAGETIVIDSPQAIEVDSVVHKTLDIELESTLKPYLDETYKCIFLEGVIHSFVGEPLSIEVWDGFHTLKVVSDYQIQAANNKPILKSDVESSFRKLGNTPFEWKSLTIESDESGFIPVKVMNDLRRSIVEEITQLRLNGKPKTILPWVSPLPTLQEPPKPTLVALVRTTDQLKAAKDAKVDKIYVDEALIDQISSEIDENIALKKRRIGANTNINDSKYETRVISEVGALNAPQMKHTWVSDEFMNVTNLESVHFLAEKGINRVTLSNEMTIEQILSLQKNNFYDGYRAPYLEKVVYGSEQLMVTKYCPIAKTFNTDLNCQLCMKNQYYLKDRTDALFPLVNDGLCNIIIYHHRPLNLIEHVLFFVENGISFLRMNFTMEDYDTTLSTIKQFQKALNGQPIVPEKGTYTLGRFIR